MKKLFRVVIIILFSYSISPINCTVVSIVYNLRIAETTKRQDLLPSYEPKPNLGVALLFAQFRKVRNETYQKAYGVLASYVYARKHFYGRIYGAVANVREKNNPLQIDDHKTQVDDILCMAGYSRDFTDRIAATFSGLLGIPVHGDKALTLIQFGTGHVGLGVQADASFVLSENRKNALRTAARFVHFFPRKVTLPINNVKECFRFSIGNTVDLFVAYHHRFGMRHTLEFGYNPSFLFDASIKPNVIGLVNEIDYIRSSVYAAYGYGFLIGKHLSGFAAAVSYSTDHRPCLFGNKYIVTAWASWGINF